MPRRYLSRITALTLLLSALALTAAGVLHSLPESSRTATAPLKPGKSAAFFSLLPPRLLP